jgi:hypothetical protein
MLGEGLGRRGLRLPAGGVDTSGSLRQVRSIHLAGSGRRNPATWLMTVGNEVVGRAAGCGPSVTAGGPKSATVSRLSGGGWAMQQRPSACWSTCY